MYTNFDAVHAANDLLQDFIAETDAREARELARQEALARQKRVRAFRKALKATEAQRRTQGITQEDDPFVNIEGIGRFIAINAGQKALDASRQPAARQGAAESAPKMEQASMGKEAAVGEQQEAQRK